MSDRQWAGMMLGDEAYAGSANFYHLEEAVRRYYGYRHLIPTHQGRGAEHILAQVMIRPGDTVPGNMYFTTTRFHQEHAGGRFVDVVIDEAHDPQSLHPFKGNVDLAKLERVLTTAARVPYVCLAATVNMAGGQPVSLANARDVRDLCRRHGVPVMLDATRAVENAWLIKCREPGQADRSVAEILREFCGLTDGCTMSGKKDPLVNIGGWLSLDDDRLAEQARNLVVVYEGLHTYGGMAGRDMEAMARGIEESVQDDHMRARVGQVEYLGELLQAAGVPIVLPIGGHAVYLDARRVYPHIPQDAFPAQLLAAELYLDSGVRAMERGIVSRQGHRQTPLPAARTRAADDPAPGLHPGSHGRGRGERRCRLRPARQAARPGDGVRARVPAVFPGPVPAAVTPPPATSPRRRPGWFCRPGRSRKPRGRGFPPATAC
jgi:tyrosine phenol-lyase